VFANRAEAGIELAKRLHEYLGRSDVIVLGIPRGGVVVAAEVARALQLPLDIVSAAKVGFPGNPEFAAGAVSPDGEVTLNPQSGLSLADVVANAGPARAKIARQLSLLRGDRPDPILAGATAIVVDDGIATGLTAIAAVDYLHRQGATVVLAAPVASRQSVQALEAHADAVVVVEVPPSFGAVGQFYRVFGQTSDDEVLALMEEAWAKEASRGGQSRYDS
jgi:putative phosphoribosyl transferase